MLHKVITFVFALCCSLPASATEDLSFNVYGVTAVIDLNRFQEAEGAEGSVSFQQEGGYPVPGYLYQYNFGYTLYDLNDNVLERSTFAPDQTGVPRSVDLSMFDGADKIGFWVETPDPEAQGYYLLNALQPSSTSFVTVTNGEATETIINSISFEDRSGGTATLSITFSDIPAGAPEPSENAIIFITAILALTYMYRQRRRSYLFNLSPAHA